MRPLVMDFAPVYLPQGADWWDFWSNEKQQDRQTLNRSVSWEGQGPSSDDRRAGKQFSEHAEKPQVQGCPGRSGLRYEKPADERQKDNKLCRKEKEYKAVTVKRRNVSKLPYYFLGADYADFKNPICIVRVTPRNPRLILQHNEVVIYFAKKETTTAAQIPSPLP